MATKHFTLIATVSTDNPATIGPLLKQILAYRGTVKQVGNQSDTSATRGEFTVNAELHGESARELNRDLLSSLRKVEKRTRIRSAWSTEGTVEEFFDYVAKKKRGAT